MAGECKMSEDDRLRVAVVLQVKFAFSAFGKVLRVEGPFQDKASHGILSRAWAIIDYETPEAAAGACAAFNNNIISAIAHAVWHLANVHV